MVNRVIHQLRTLLILGRASNLPTVWSNCLAGWWLGGGGNPGKLPLLFVGITLLYTGGMFLNDAFDADFDKNHRKERPIPTGAITHQAVWRWGVIWLASGALCLTAAGKVTGALSLALLLCILIYDAAHKLVTFSPVLMGVCRFFVYPVAASTSVNGVTGWAIWCGLALAAYVIGLSVLARRERVPLPTRYSPILLLAAPIALALLINVGSDRQPGLLVSLVLALWIIRCLRTTYLACEINVSLTVSGLLAGIVFVDWLAVAATLSVPRELGFAFLMLFGSAVLLQKLVPST